MTINDFYKLCLTLQPKSSIRVYYKESCIYNGEYGNLPIPIAKHKIATILVNPNMEWKFYLEILQ